jgi:hypothetical protein
MPSAPNARRLRVVRVSALVRTSGCGLRGHCMLVWKLPKPALQWSAALAVDLPWNRRGTSRLLRVQGGLVVRVCAFSEVATSESPPTEVPMRAQRPRWEVHATAQSGCPEKRTCLRYLGVVSRGQERPFRRAWTLPKRPPRELIASAGQRTRSGQAGCEGQAFFSALGSKVGRQSASCDWVDLGERFLW